MHAKTRLGIMGGTFNPIHKGHLAIAQSAAEQLSLDRVLFIPTGNPHFKLGQELTPEKNRARMVELAIEGNLTFELDMREVNRPGVTYTADTLEELNQEYPEAELFFIVGSDSASTLPRWKRADVIARLCTVVVAQRPGQDINTVKGALNESPIEYNVEYIDAPQIDASSTAIREAVARGDDVRGVVSQNVLDYIKEQGLYKTN